MSLQRLRARALADFQSPSVWEAIEAAYTQAHRRYHTLGHLHRMFAVYDDVADEFAHPLAVRIAIWFHDYIYDVGSDYPLNEERSAEAMQQLLAGSPPAEAAAHDLQFTARLISATKGHVARPDMFIGPELADAWLFLDIDLEILSAPSALADAFDECVRAEFAAVPEALFASARVKALNAFLQRPRVYLSAPFAHREDSARHNLARLVRRWRSVLEAG